MSTTLKDLANVLDTDDAHHWSRMNLVAMFPAEAVADPEGMVLANRASKVEWLRNVLILAPLLITWVGIAFATARYGELLEESPEMARRPFIQLWQQGFQNGSTRFSTIGFLDVAAIVVVIVLSVWLGHLRRRVEVDVAARETIVWNRLQSCLAETSVYLARVSFDSPLRMNEALTKAAVSLQGISAEIMRSSSSVISLMVAASETVYQFDRGHDEMGKSTKEFAAHAAQMEQAVTALSSGLSSLNSRSEEALNQTKALVGTQRDLVDKMKSSLDHTSTTSEALSDATSNAAGLIDRLRVEREAQASASEALARTADQFTASAETLAAVLAKAQEAADAARNAGSGFGTAAEEIARAIGEVNRVTSSVEVALGATVESLPGRLEIVASQVETSLRSMTAELRTATKSLDRAANALVSGAGQSQPGKSRSRQSWLPWRRG